MKHLILNPGFESLHPFANNIHQTFKHFGKDIHKGRNHLKIFNVKGKLFCVKSFGRPTLANMFIYSFFRKGKAQRSYQYAHKLIRMGINTPEPVGYVEIYNNWRIMTESYYISAYDPPAYTIREVMTKDIPDKNTILKAFAKFIANDLHLNGIYHNDFNGGNILVYNESKNRYRFALVDLNRISFNKKVNFNKALANIKSVCNDPISLAILSGYYAHERHTDPTKAMFQIITMKYLGSHLRHYKKTFLRRLKSLFDFRLQTTKV